MPFALDEIRKFGRAGHEVFAADTFGTTPGNHSRYAVESFVTPSPKRETQAFLRELREIITNHRIDLYAPAFEEVFYVAKHRHEFDPVTRVFAPDFDILARLHDKEQFVKFARELGVPTPDTRIARDQPELHDHLDDLGRYLARPAYSRGGVTLLSNVGQRAGKVDPGRVEPEDGNPWLVQEYVDGTDVCSFSVAREGKLIAHSNYVHPKTIESSGGIVFESVVEPKTMEYARRFIEATGYDGQISFDFMKAEDGTFYVIECNPRPTAGVIMMPQDMFVKAVLDEPPARPMVAPAGMRRHFASALVRDMFVNPREVLSDLRELLSSTPDVYAEPGDRWPGLYQWLSYSHVLKFKHSRWLGRRPTRRRSAAAESPLLEGYFHDVSWNGEAIA